MMLLRIAVVVLLCCLLSTANSQPARNKKSLPVFTVNKKTVTTDEFIYLYKKNHQNKPEEFTQEKIQEYLDLFINFKLKVTEARQRGLDTTAAFRKEFESYREELRKPYLPDNKLGDSLTRMTYERLKEEVKASHILIGFKADSPSDTLAAYNKIMDLRKRALNGEDFATLATQFSEDPSAKSNHGSLGYFTTLQMVFPFENAAYTTAVNGISMPVRTQFGYHIVKVFDRRPASGEVEVSHIMIRSAGDKDDKAKNQIFEIHDQLRAGVKWEDLCKQYSQDPGTKDQGGRIKPFGTGGMPKVPVFEQISFSLKDPGEISDPFQTQFGWHIIRLERKIPLPPYEDVAAALKPRVLRDDRTQVSKQLLQSKLKKEFNLVEYPSVKGQVMALADTTLRKGTWKPVKKFTDKDILFSLQGKPVTAANFLAYAIKNQKATAQTPEKYLESLYNNFVDSNINNLLEDRIARQNPDFQLLLTEYYEGILLFDIMEKEVWNKASEDSVGQVNYFSANAMKYTAGERVKAVVYSAQSGDALSKVAEKISSGDTLRLYEYVAMNKVRQENGLFEKEDKPVLSAVQWSKGVHKTQVNGVNYLVWIKNILSPGQKAFQEARASVISDYQGYLEKGWIESLKKKYPVKVNEKGKKYVFAQLLAK